MISAKRINTLQEVAALQLNHWCLAAVGVAFIELWNHLNGFYIPFPFLMWLAAGIIPIYLQVIRKKVSQVFLVVITHLAALVTIPVASFLWPETYALYGFLVVAYMVFSLYYKLSAEKDVMPLFPLMGVGISLLIPVVMLLLLKRQAAIDLIIVGTVFLVGFYLLCFYISNLNRYYTLSKDTVDGMPFARILGSGFKRVSVYAGIIMLLSFAVSRFQVLEEISKFIIDMIIMVIRIVVRAFFAWMAKQKYDYGADDVVEIIKPEEMPEVDGLLGTGSYADVVAAVEKLLEGKYSSRTLPLFESAAGDTAAAAPGGQQGTYQDDVGDLTAAYDHIVGILNLFVCQYQTVYHNGNQVQGNNSNITHKKLLILPFADGCPQATIKTP